MREYTDEELLTILDCRERQAMPFSKVIDRLKEEFGISTTKGSLIGIVGRIRRTSDELGDAGDGTMWPGWWRKGLEARK